MNKNKSVIAHGAEAILEKRDNIIIKNRIKKSYRFPELDEKLRKLRTRKEAKILEKANKIIPVPKLIKFSEKDKTIEIEYIAGKKLSDHLDTIKDSNEVCRKIGENIAKLHDNNIIHGDLTTSNMILFNNNVYFIDFGLSFESHHIEDRAVDLHLIKEALEAKHYEKAKDFFLYILEGYKLSSKYKETLKRLEKVEKRGRYKKQY